MGDTTLPAPVREALSELQSLREKESDDGFLKEKEMLLNEKERLLTKKAALLNETQKLLKVKELVLRVKSAEMKNGGDDDHALDVARAVLSSQTPPLKGSGDGSFRKLMRVYENAHAEQAKTQAKVNKEELWKSIKTNHPQVYEAALEVIGGDETAMTDTIEFLTTI